MKRTLVLVTSLVLTALVFTVAPFAAGAQGGQGNVYAVQSGDTAYSIASRYCMSYQELYGLNSSSMSNPNQLYPGMQVQVINRCGAGSSGAGSSGGGSGGGWNGGGSSGTGNWNGGNCGWGGVYDRGPKLHAQGYVHGNTYVVAAGDTAYSIAQRFGTSTYAIGQANGINPWYIYAGQRLILPSYGGSCQPPTCGAYGGYGCPQPCSGYGGYGCPPNPYPYPYPVPSVYPIPITPVPTTPPTQVTLEITSPGENTALTQTFTVSGVAGGLPAGTSITVRALTGPANVRDAQVVTLQPGGPGGLLTFSATLHVTVQQATSGSVVAYPTQQGNPTARVDVLFGGSAPPPAVSYKDFNSQECRVSVVSGAQYYGAPGGTATGQFGNNRNYEVGRGAKLNNQYWFLVGPLPSTATMVWAPAASVTNASAACTGW